jgi:hypothetical protein
VIVTHADLEVHPLAMYRDLAGDEGVPALLWSDLYRLVDVATVSSIAATASAVPATASVVRATELATAFSGMEYHSSGKCRL